MAAAASQGGTLVQLYQEACLNGELRLTAARGSVVPASEVPATLQGQGLGTQLERVVYVKMQVPELTYVIMQWYSKSDPRKIRYDCSVASKNWSVTDAGVGFYLDTPKSTAEKVPFGNVWIIDEPKLGVQKVLRQLNANWVMLTVSEYQETKH